VHPVQVLLKDTAKQDLPENPLLISSEREVVSTISDLRFATSSSPRRSRTSRSTPAPATSGCASGGGTPRSPSRSRTTAGAERTPTAAPDSAACASASPRSRGGSTWSRRPARGRRSGRRSRTAALARRHALELGNTARAIGSLVLDRRRPVLRRLWAARPGSPLRGRASCCIRRGWRSWRADARRLYQLLLRGLGPPAPRGACSSET
jgi:hypothetical protein